MHQLSNVTSVEHIVFAQYLMVRFSQSHYVSSLLNYAYLSHLRCKYTFGYSIYSGFCVTLLDFIFFSSLRFYFIHSDVNSMYLSSTEPPAAAEWACLLRPLRGREPEGIWNLLSIVREMFKRRDSNAAPLLEILTDQCLNYEQVSEPLCYRGKNSGESG